MVKDTDSHPYFKLMTTTLENLVYRTDRFTVCCSGFMRLTGIVLFLVTASYPARSIAEDQQQADGIVEKLHNTLMHVMQNSEDLGFEGRYKELAPVILSYFDTPLIAKVILSRQWGDMDDDDKRAFVDLYNKLIIATYASRFVDYDGERFLTLSIEQLSKGRVLVKTELQRPNDKPVKLDYLMSQNDDNWMIISVIANGANDLAIKRGEYADVIKRKSYDELISEIQSKIYNMEKET